VFAVFNPKEERGGDYNGPEKGRKGETQGGKAKAQRWFQEGEITSGGKTPINFSYIALGEGFWVP